MTYLGGSADWVGGETCWSPFVFGWVKGSKNVTGLGEGSEEIGPHQMGG